MGKDKTFNKTHRGLDHALAVGKFNQAERVLLLEAREASYATAVLLKRKDPLPFVLAVSEIARRFGISRQYLVNAKKRLMDNRVFIESGNKLLINKEYRQWLGTHQLTEIQAAEADSAQEESHMNQILKSQGIDASKNSAKNTNANTHDLTPTVSGVTPTVSGGDTDSVRGDSAQCQEVTPTVSGVTRTVSGSDTDSVTPPTPQRVRASEETSETVRETKRDMCETGRNGQKTEDTHTKKISQTQKKFEKLAREEEARKQEWLQHMEELSRGLLQSWEREHGKITR